MTDRIKMYCPNCGAVVYARNEFDHCPHCHDNRLEDYEGQECEGVDPYEMFDTP